MHAHIFENQCSQWLIRCLECLGNRCLSATGARGATCGRRSRSTASCRASPAGPCIKDPPTTTAVAEGLVWVRPEGLFFVAGGGGEKSSQILDRIEEPLIRSGSKGLGLGLVPLTSRALRKVVRRGAGSCLGVPAQPKLSYENFPGGGTHFLIVYIFLWGDVHLVLQ